MPQALRSMPQGRQLGKLRALRTEASDAISSRSDAQIRHFSQVMQSSNMSARPAASSLVGHINLSYSTCMQCLKCGIAELSSDEVSTPCAAGRKLEAAAPSMQRAPRRAVAVEANLFGRVGRVFRSYLNAVGAWSQGRVSAACFTRTRNTGHCVLHRITACKQQ